LTAILYRFDEDVQKKSKALAEITQSRAKAQTFKTRHESFEHILCAITPFAAAYSFKTKASLEKRTS
jgi:hypothetical protein